ncbi:alpha/beta fold hydrolase [Minwuia sp.]|uniref:alpha/beta fold hydrolase n=1 Tax=Minwuia sp. TaxID=2493630 RepID=UPI003A8FADBE
MITEHAVKSARHTTFYLASGPDDGTPIIFVHGWPELSISWRGQLPVFGGLGFRAIAPDMRGYGRSSCYDTHGDYCLEEIVADMVELLDHIGAERAIWVGHDWGAPVVWAMAQHHPERCLGIANLCVPYLPEALSPETLAPLVNRDIYPEDRFPVGQWDYFLYYRENFEAACAAFEADPAATVRILFRSGSPDVMDKPGRTASVRASNGWFGGGGAPDLPRDANVISAAEEAAYAAALTRNGFFGPDSWYMNGDANQAFAEQARDRWRLTMPVLFIHAKYDVTCETLVSRLADPMREWCSDLTEHTVESGHWMAQERPRDVNSALARWLGRKLPEYWRGS